MGYLGKVDALRKKGELIREFRTGEAEAGEGVFHPRLDVRSRQKV